MEKKKEKPRQLIRSGIVHFNHPHGDTSLTAKQEQFCQEYLIDLNATQAAIRTGLSKKSAASQASTLLTVPKVLRRIAELQADRNNRTAVSQDRVVKELARIAFADMRKFSSWDGDEVTLEDSTKLSDDDAACVASVNQTTTKEGGNISFKLHDKVRALEMLGRHTGVLNKDGELIPQSPVNVYNVINVEQREKLEKLHTGADAV